MCHSGARNVNEKPGTPSCLAGKIKSFWKLIPKDIFVAYKAIGNMPETQADKLGLSGGVLVTPGGHDTCVSHIPIMSTFYQSFPEHAGKPVIQIDAGTWTMGAQIGGSPVLPEDGYKKGTLVQGTVDGNPVVTTQYGGGNDFKHIKGLVEGRGLSFEGRLDENLLKEILEDSNCFVLPNINPSCYQTGPFPELKGRIINEDKFFENSDKAYIISNLTTAITSAYHIELISSDKAIPVVLTAGGSRDPYFGRLIATITRRKVFAMYDRDGNPINETTTLGAAITGKAAHTNIHPYDVDVRSLGVSYKELKAFEGDISRHIIKYREQLLNEIINNK